MGIEDINPEVLEHLLKHKEGEEIAGNPFAEFVLQSLGASGYEEIEPVAPRDGRTGWQLEDFLEPVIPGREGLHEIETYASADGAQIEDYHSQLGEISVVKERGMPYAIGERGDQRPYERLWRKKAQG